MKHLFAALFVLASVSVQAQVLDRRPFNLPPYAELPAAMRQVQREDRYDRLRSETGVVFEQFSYLSDGLRINAFIARPAAVAGRLPVVVYLRPGVGEAAAIGLLSLHNFYEMQKYAAAGFLVVASQFRGTGGSEDKDEIGGARSGAFPRRHASPGHGARPGTVPGLGTWPEGPRRRPMRPVRTA